MAEPMDDSEMDAEVESQEEKDMPKGLTHFCSAVHLITPEAWQYLN